MDDKRTIHLIGNVGRYQVRYSIKKLEHKDSFELSIIYKEHNMRVREWDADCEKVKQMLDEFIKNIDDIYCARSR